MAENAWVFVGLSCVFGIPIGYSGWAARDMVSATTYTLVGVVNKLISVAFSVMVINNTATVKSVGALLVCLIGSTFYQQAPMRQAKIPT